LFSAALPAQFRGGGGPAGQLMREGKMDEALDVYKKELQANPNSASALTGAGVVLDLMGKNAEARTYFQKLIDTAPDAAAKAQAQRHMAESYGFSGDCKNAVKYEQMVIDYWTERKDAYQQGEMANEAARFCIDSGDLDTAEKMYKLGYDYGINQPDITPDRKHLWEFRLEHALARIAARRGNKAEAQKHVVAAKAAVDAIHDNTAGQQQQFYHYLVGYVALYSGEYQKALDALQQAQNDAFVQTLIGDAYEKLGPKEKAMEYYRKAAAVTGHNPPAAYARPYARKKIGE
jgi:tetratricopeptide (TPR) repeat protein